VTVSDVFGLRDDEIHGLIPTGFDKPVSAPDQWDF